MAQATPGEGAPDHEQSREELIMNATRSLFKLVGQRSEDNADSMMQDYNDFQMDLALLTPSERLAVFKEANERKELTDKANS